jgi:hypothetical protein
VKDDSGELWIEDTEVLKARARRSVARLFDDDSDLSTVEQAVPPRAREGRPGSEDETNIFDLAPPARPPRTPGVVVDVDSDLGRVLDVEVTVLSRPPRREGGLRSEEDTTLFPTFHGSRTPPPPPPPAPPPCARSSRARGDWEVKTDSESRAPLADAPEEAPVDQPRSHDGPEELTFEGTRRVYSALCAVAHVDGKVRPVVRAELETLQDYLGLPTLTADLLERDACRTRQLRIGRRPAELELLLGAMIDLAAIDGRVSTGERRLIDRVNQRAGWPAARLEAAITAALERSRAQAASAALRLLDDEPAFQPTRSTPFGLESGLRHAPLAAPGSRSIFEDSGEGELIPYDPAA